MDPDSDRAVFFLDLRGANKIKLFFFFLLLFEGTFTSFLKDKKS